jgi:hypothetical protein
VGLKAVELRLKVHLLCASVIHGDSNLALGLIDRSVECRLQFIMPQAEILSVVETLA